MGSKPVIGVTGPTQGGQFAWIMTWLALHRAGAKAIHITVDAPFPPDQLDGIIIGGGSDIDPHNYGEEFKEIQREAPSHFFRDRLWSFIQLILRIMLSIKTSQPKQDTDRDTMEQELCRFALRNKLPILGICRGAQLLNITLGGTLHQDTASFYAERPNIKTLLPRKHIRIVEGSKLHRIIGRTEYYVNSLHDQAVNDLGENLRITATEDNSVVQAIEHKEFPFALGVQWHPEYLPQRHTQQRIFRSLAASATDYRNRRAQQR